MPESVTRLFSYETLTSELNLLIRNTVRPFCKMNRKYVMVCVCETERVEDKN